ncbi:MAG: SprT-like domain-containing protein [Methylococcales bacterium]|nr:SprT-like domain-containing protein [Methylococcales bacterium]
MKPTIDTYAELQLAYDTFNRLLFDEQLPDCIITLQRSNPSRGYFSAERFANIDGQKTDEIALNPAYFAVVPLVKIMEELVHQLCHLWQFHYGTPGRGRYHNIEWANKMESIGLMPSDTGQPEGKKVGDIMSNYALADGAFLLACTELLTNDFRISWYDRFPTNTAIDAGHNSYSQPIDLPEGGEDIAAESENIEIETPDNAENKSNRSKYVCHPCGINVWGKPELNIICGKCNGTFTEQD